MPTLREQIIPRRKLMLIASEAVIFTGVLFVGTAYRPLATVDFTLDFETWKSWQFLLSCVTIAILWQAEWELAALGDTWPLLAFLAVALLVRGKG